MQFPLRLMGLIKQTLGVCGSMLVHRVVCVSVLVFVGVVYCVCVGACVADLRSTFT